MSLTGQVLANIGMVHWGLLFICVSWGLLRNNIVILVNFIISCILFYLGLKYFSLELPCKGNSNGAGFLFGPIIFIILYASLRAFYKKVYKMEPDIEAYSGYSSRDKRGLNFLDYTTALVPILASAIVSIILANQ